MTLSFNQHESKQTRQRLRGSMPPAEVMLWAKLKSRQLLGCKFRRQYGIESYTVDFYSAELKLAIELDGESHYASGKPGFDERRDARIRAFGIRVLRFLNTDVYDNLEGVWEAIASVAKERMDELGPDVVRGRRDKRATRGQIPGSATPPTPPC